MSVIGATAINVYVDKDNSMRVLANVPIPIYFVLSGETTGIPVRIEIVDPPTEKAIPDSAAIPVFLIVDPDVKVTGNLAIRVYDIDA